MGEARADLTDLIVRRRLALPAARPLLVAVTGPVAVGKTVFAGGLVGALGVEPAAAPADLISTDGFLFPNADLAARGLLMRKGYPESFDFAALAALLSALREGRPADAPVYSHLVYDVTAERRPVPPAARTVVVEGLHLLRPGLAALFDLTIYLDAEEADLIAWYVARFIALGRAEASGVQRLAEALGIDCDLPPPALAEAIWRAVNRPLWREHIAPTEARADVVVNLGADHTVRALTLR